MRRYRLKELFVGAQVYVVRLRTYVELTDDAEAMRSVLGDELFSYYYEPEETESRKRRSQQSNTDGGSAESSDGVAGNDSA
ncbi:MAG: hypothetical protein KatS3mg038_2150 [Candidatus Kapaibacterium sp.]|nr:MAG: hypothetical protein KatS3mg038_2150 [Candidatus Kapabacteria bacterium]